MSNTKRPSSEEVTKFYKEAIRDSIAFYNRTMAKPADNLYEIARIIDDIAMSKVNMKYSTKDKYYCSESPVVDKAHNRIIFGDVWPAVIDEDFVVVDINEEKITDVPGVGESVIYKLSVEK